MFRLRTLLALLLLTALLLTAGCESETPEADTPATQTLSTIPTRVTTQPTPVATVTDTPVPVETIPTETPVSARAEPLPPPANYRPDYITMDATSYVTGEVVRFYLVNKGPEIAGCSYTRPPYTVYRQYPDGTRTQVAKSDPSRSYSMTIIAGEPGSATGPLSVDTRKMPPGRYLIIFDCGNNVAREFMILPRAKTSVISPSE
jgi:hypothetical protein